MKSSFRFLFAIATVGAMACGAGAVLAAQTHSSADDSAPAPADTKDAVVAIEVPEVECASCSLEARKAIKGAGGVRRLGEGNPKNRIVVTYEPGAGRPEVYVEALHQAGFARARAVQG